MHFNKENQIVGEDNQPVKYEYIPAKTTTKNTITEKETFTGLTAGNKWWYYDLPYDQKGRITKKVDELKTI